MRKCLTNTMKTVTIYIYESDEKDNDGNSDYGGF